jgi:hypothetical protein
VSQDQAISYSVDDILPGARAVSIAVPARLVVGWKYVRPWELDAMTETGRHVMALLDLVPGIEGMDVGRHRLYVVVAPPWSPEQVGAEIVEALQPIFESRTAAP